MTTSFILKRMIDTELHFASRFTGMTTKDWGLLFWNEGNKTSHDSNHAIIIDQLGVESTLKEIFSFYKGKGITPRIYPSLKSGELESLRPHLERHGYQIESYPTKYYLHQQPSGIRPLDDFFVQRIRQVDDMLMNMIIEGGGGEWTIKVVQRHLLHPSYHLLGGFVEENLVCVASVGTFAGYSRVDDVMTHPAYRGKGYSSALIDYLVKYHKNLSDNNLYLYTKTPEAGRIYEKAGFVEIPERFDGWSAHKDLS